MTQVLHCLISGLMGFTRNIAEDDIQYFTHRNDVGVVSPFLTGTDIPHNVKSTRVNVVNGEQVQYFVHLYANSIVAYLIVYSFMLDRLKKIWIKTHW